MRRNTPEILTYKLSLISAKDHDKSQPGRKTLEIKQKVVLSEVAIPDWNGNGVNVHSKTLKINTKQLNPP